MKKLSEVVSKESAPKFEVADDAMNFVSAKDLKKYLDVTEKFLSDEGKKIINWLIEHNDTYVDDLGRANAKNALESFINGKIPEDPEKKDLYKTCKVLIKKGNSAEIPVFQSKEEFDDIVNKVVSLDKMTMDFISKSGREAIAKKYDPLVWKIARSYIGKSKLDLNELYSAGLLGLIYAMNDYGNKTEKSKNAENISQTSFLSYAGFRIRNTILDEIRNKSHMIRIPISKQRKEKEETGKNTKSNTISLDTVVGTDKDGNTKTLLDKISDYERAGKTLDYQDIENSWDNIKDALEAKFSKKTLDIIYSKFGLFGHKKLKGEEIMKKYNFKNNSDINAEQYRFIREIKKDKKLWNMFVNIRDLISECQAEDEAEDRDYEPIYVGTIDPTTIYESEDE